MKKTVFIWLAMAVIFVCPFSLQAKDSLIDLGGYFGASLTFGMEVNYYQLDLPDQLLDVKADPADSLTGSTKVDLTDGWGVNFRMHLRLFYLAEESPVNFFIGTDLGINPMASGGYRAGIYEVNLSHYGGESYAYAQLMPAWYILNPVVGMSIPPVVFEVGFPYNEFTLVTGNDRYGHWDRTDSYTWRGFGQRYYLGLDFSFGVGLSYEKYQTEFSGYQADIESWNLLLTYKFL